MQENDNNKPTECQPVLFSSLTEFELAFRELKIEFDMKRNEVEKLKTELEQIQHENYTLKESLDKLHKSSEEMKINQDMFKQRNENIEPKFFETRRAFVKAELKYEMEMQNKNLLKDQVQKISLERAELMRKISGLEEEKKHHFMYTKDILNKLEQLQAVVALLTNEQQKLNADLQYAKTLTETVDLIQESTKKCNELSAVVKKLKKEKMELEEECVKQKAKAEHLETYISDHNLIMEEENIEARAYLNQCKKLSQHYNTIIRAKNEIMVALTERLKQEQSANMKLMVENETNIHKLEKMEKKLIHQPGELLNLEQVDVTVVKNEIELIEITDTPT